ncbi:beta-galactosidase [Microdochium trichocladiopsis]|uniref:Beta-galactosidase n=1 Tax=Microdochium trichocladiopsis TaxID=1682393 RepID=A0A9P9BR26_9PEZI|nr:beta-galactosidase [Microdochium trichocladiopsis]KAH7031502.1 beta-galactosidase [Microdochium trichocladiopsis]
MKVAALGLLTLTGNTLAYPTTNADNSSPRERLSINTGWKFQRFTTSPDGLSYNGTLKPWILPSANDMLVDAPKYVRPEGTPPGADVPYVQGSFDDASWETVNVPHDWAIKGPFGAPGISGGMGRLPSDGIGWYRRTIAIDAADEGKNIYLDIDGAMSYSAVWLNGVLVGGWPYGYTSFRLDLTPYVKVGEDNILAIRLDNPVEFSRWYPGAGLYRNVWLVKTSPVHVGHYGSRVRTPAVSAEAATVELAIDIVNAGKDEQQVTAVTEVRAVGSQDVVATFPSTSDTVAAGEKQTVNASVTILTPQLWGPPPEQTPNLYEATTTLTGSDGQVLDTYTTRFGIRSIVYDANQGLLVNGARVYLKGTCNHHDQGALGAAFHVAAARRHLTTLQEMGSNALRTTHNPPAPEFLELADELGFLVLDEAFDMWRQAKVDNDYHLVFDDWHEADLRSLLRRDGNHPSVYEWSIGNEIPEQRTAAGAATGKILVDIVRSEDPTRPATCAFNSAGPSDALPGVVDNVGLNYQGEGRGDSFSSPYPTFHSLYPGKMIYSSETSSALSTRGEYIFPVVSNMSAIVANGRGANFSALTVSDYGLYGPSWGSSPDKVFFVQDRYQPYAAGEYVWTGFDYLGEPTPYDDYALARSSYFGIVDLAGFKKDRFWLYQARWNPDVKTAHILPHWSFGEDRVGKVTPVHVLSSADEAELFVNGASAGRVTRPASEWRLRWNNVTYAPGELRVVAYKGGNVWAEETVRTASAPAALQVSADRTTIAADGYDLSYVSVSVVDERGDVVPTASNTLTFAVEGAGEIVATDNGSPIDQTVFPSLTRKAFNGKALAIVRTLAGQTGEIKLTVKGDGLAEGTIALTAA